jgi:hypothetical protein
MKFQEHPSNGIRDAPGRILFLHLKCSVSLFSRNHTQHSAGNVLRVRCAKFQENSSNGGRYTAVKLVSSPSKGSLIIGRSRRNYIV